MSMQESLGQLQLEFFNVFLFTISARKRDLDRKKEQLYKNYLAFGNSKMDGEAKRRMKGI